MSDRILQVLDVGSGGSPIKFDVLHKLYPEAADDFIVTALDVDESVEPDIVHDIRDPLPEEYHGKFNVVWMSHVLEHFTRYEAVPVLRNIRQVMDQMAEIWVWVPSMEWAAQQILDDHPSPVTLSAIYGQQDSPWQYHKSGYTLRGLRFVLSDAGFIPRHVFHTGMVIQLRDEQGEITDYKALQNVALGLRYDQMPVAHVDEKVIEDARRDPV